MKHLKTFEGYEAYSENDISSEELTELCEFFIQHYDEIVRTDDMKYVYDCCKKRIQHFDYFIDNVDIISFLVDFKSFYPNVDGLVEGFKFFEELN